MWYPRILRTRLRAYKQATYRVIVSFFILHFFQVIRSGRGRERTLKQVPQINRTHCPQPFCFKMFCAGSLFCVLTSMLCFKYLCINFTLILCKFNFLNFFVYFMKNLSVFQNHPTARSLLSGIKPKVSLWPSLGGLPTKTK